MTSYACNRCGGSRPAPENPDAIEEGGEVELWCDQCDDYRLMTEE